MLSPGGGRGGDGLVSNQGRMHVNPMNSELSAGGNMMRHGGMGHNDSLNSSFDSRKPGAYGGNDGASAYGGNSQLRMSGKIP